MHLLNTVLNRVNTYAIIYFIYLIDKKPVCKFLSEKPNYRAHDSSNKEENFRRG